MSKKGERKQQKRISSPRVVKVLKKTSKWLMKPRTGAHGKNSVALAVILRDYLRIADNANEARKIIKAGKVKVDGRVVKDHKKAIGFMDLIEIPSQKLVFRVVLDEKGRIALKELKENPRFKLGRIEKKTKIRKGKTQITLHDGKNIVSDKDEYKIGDVLKISLPDQKIMKKLSLKEGSLAYIIGGKHAGETAIVKSIEKGSMTRRILIGFDKEGKQFTAPREQVFIIGEKEPEIKLK